MATRKLAQHRFWDKVAKGGPDECWLWTAGTNKDGYGKLSVRRKSTLAHRLLPPEGE